MTRSIISLQSRAFTSPWMCARHKSKINFRKPKVRTLQRRIFEAVTRPIVPEIHQVEVLCPKLDAVKVVEENRYEQFLIRKCKEMYNTYPMIAVFQHLPMSKATFHKIKNKLHKDSLYLKRCNNSVSLQSIKDTKWENLAPLFQGHNMYIVAEEPKLKEIIKVSKTTPELILLAAFVEDRILGVSDIQHYAEKPNIELLRGELVSILSSSANKTHSLLGSHQTKLSANLTQYAKQLSESEPQKT